ncbi:hypothetical protein BCR41DRAFT_355171 [Lobosporangium transversale]|uniref:Uncharacterized protein n=1 Tax=Lobosporangium transversale TaxID=64571 RepID=A0A1Y2GKT2_9FUNG|nr:hypothetical protein BCR41DRAFT_355171 [Lobosporangium transversale]ORZ13915.1 hypothetical protein BCR41DRAFT_355171 [Lobosporangium transversale]|eukprot:XP_021880699.1 hypothetical protein BCR41DRAFT_355171 [Lobosporangium transversale]
MTKNGRKHGGSIGHVLLSILHIICFLLTRGTQSRPTGLSLVFAGKVVKTGRNHKSENAYITEITAVPAKVLCGRFAHTHPLLNSGIRSQVSTHGFNI